jgi:hypothetical protein
LNSIFLWLNTLRFLQGRKSDFFIVNIHFATPDILPHGAAAPLTPPAVPMVSGSGDGVLKMCEELDRLAISNLADVTYHINGIISIYYMSVTNTQKVQAGSTF